jgi:shikimate 5-dehydrogenase
LSEGASVTLFNRSINRGGLVARATGASHAPLGELAGASWDVLVQATPLGRNGEGVLPGLALTGRMVLDAAYGPVASPLVLDARRRGLAVADGYDLLAAQGALQFHRLTGRTVDASVFSAALAPWRPQPGA